MIIDESVLKPFIMIRRDFKFREFYFKFLMIDFLSFSAFLFIFCLGNVGEPFSLLTMTYITCFAP